MKNNLRLSVIILLFSFSFSINAYSADTVVALSHFKLNGPPEKSYVKDALFDMTATRLASYEEISVVKADGSVDKDNFKSTLTSLKADFVLTGSVTVMGEAISIDGQIYNKDGLVNSFYSTLKGMGELINSAELMAGRVVFVAGGGTASSGDLAGGNVQVSSEIQPQETATVKLKVEKTTAVTPGTGSVKWKSKKFDIKALSFATGDFDGNNILDAAILTEQALYFYELNTKDGLITFKQKVSWPDNHKGVYVGNYDFDGDNIDDLIVGLGPQKTSTLGKSLIIGHDGSSFVIKKDKIKFMLRNTKNQKGKDVLLGRKFRTIAGFDPKTYLMKYKKNKFVKAGEFELDRSVGLYNFEFFNVIGSKRSELLYLGKKGRLSVDEDMVGKWERLWRSSDTYGGTLAYMDYGGGDFYESVQSSFYFEDIDNGGQLLLKQNKAGGVFGSFSKKATNYKNSSVVSLSWNGVSFSQNWKTIEVEGFLADFALLDGGMLMLVNEGTGLGATRPQSYLFFYDMP